MRITLQGTNISPKNGILKMIFLFPRWDMLIPWRVVCQHLFDVDIFLNGLKRRGVSSVILEGEISSMAPVQTAQDFF